MCDVNDEKLSAEQVLTRINTKTLIGSNCMKCKDAMAAVVVRAHDPLCRECFLAYTTHKFRSTLGKARLIKANDKVLLAISTGHSSTAMMRLVHEALSENAHKRLKFSPAVVFVDELATLPDNTTYDFSSIQKTSEDFGYPFYEIPIYQNFYNHSDKSLNKQKFGDVFNSITTLSAKTEFISRIRTSLIIDTAVKMGYPKVMIGENATTLSIKLLCNVAQGRGATIPQDIGVADNRFRNITIIRPMREFSSKEVALYNRLNNIEINPVSNIETMQGKNSSLQRQTEEFVIGLQADFPSTVNTVFRTGDKICVNKDMAGIDRSCVLCQGPLIRVSNQQSDINTCNSSSCCGSSEECSSGKFTLSSDDVRGYLCYGCDLTFKDMGYRVDWLPCDVSDAVSSDMKRLKLRESIQDFLLEES